jgi:hypothetical protein
MEAELRALIQLLNESSVKYWMNHGTLLGLMREGKPIASDRDIESYRDMNYQYKFERKDAGQIVKVDFHLIRLFGNYAWRPQRGIMDNPYSGIVGEVFRFVRRLLSTYERCYFGLTNRLNLTSPHVRFCHNVGTTWTPSHYFLDLIKLDDWDCYIPRDWDDYLTFKYRDWRTPHKGAWNFWTMEGGLIHKDPLEVMKESEQEAEKSGADQG